MGSEFPDWVVKKQAPGKDKSMLFMMTSPDTSKMPAWMKRCISYWGANGPKNRGLCNERGFALTMRENYGDKMDSRGHHWGPGRVTSEGAVLRERDFDKYMEDCERLNAEDPPPEARTKKKRKKRSKKPKKPKKSKKSKKSKKRSRKPRYDNDR